jgi:hypothetical protein
MLQLQFHPIFKKNNIRGAQLAEHRVQAAGQLVLCGLQRYIVKIYFL